MRRYLFILLTAALFLSACTTKESGNAGSSDEKVYKWVVSHADSTINPHDSSAIANYEIIDLITASLYRWVPVNGEPELVPCLAAAEPSTEDGLTWTITVSPDAKWANGERITANDFIYSWQMGLDPGLAYTAAGNIAAQQISIKNASAYHMGEAVWDNVGFKAPDENTLIITTEEKASEFEIMLHFAHRTTTPVYRELYERGMDDQKTTTAYGSELGLFMASGPYTLTNWVKGSEREFKKNENYVMADMIKLSGIEGRVAIDDAARQQLFESGESDFLDLGLGALSTYIDDPRLRPFDLKAIRTLEFNRSNPERPILSDPDFRKAVYYAIDRESLAEIVNGTPAEYFISTLAVIDGAVYRQSDEAANWLPEDNGYDPELAKEYFEISIERFGLDGLELSLTYSEDVPTLRAASEFLQNSFKEVFGESFNMNLNPMPHTMALDLMRESVAGETDSWDICWSGWSLAAETFAPQAKFAPYLSTAANRYTNYQNAYLDEMYPRFKDEEYRNDTDKRLKLIAAIEKSILLEDMTCVPVFQERAHAMFSERVVLPVEGYTPMLGFAWEYADIR